MLKNIDWFFVWAFIVFIMIGIVYMFISMFIPDSNWNFCYSEEMQLKNVSELPVKCLKFYR